MKNRDHDNPLQHIKIPPLSNLSLKRTRPRHLEPESFSDERTNGSDFTVPNPDEIDVLRM